jgi:hypothetical protein
MNTEYYHFIANTKTTKLCASIAFSIYVVSQLILSPRARADENRDICILAGAGYGLQDDDDAGSFGAALGLKGSYRLLDWIYLGIEGTFHIGTSFDGEQNRVQYYGVEAGASYVINRIAMTPYLTGGVAFVSSQRNLDSSLSTGYCGLGLLVDVVVVEWFTVGADARFVLIPGGIQQSDNSGVASTFDFLFLAGARL